MFNNKKMIHKTSTFACKMCFYQTFFEISRGLIFKKTVSIDYANLGGDYWREVRPKPRRSHKESKYWECKLYVNDSTVPLEFTFGFKRQTQRFKEGLAFARQMHSKSNTEIMH